MSASTPDAAQRSCRPPPDAAAWSRVARAVVGTTYPWAPGHLVTGPDDTHLVPGRLHPAFHGSLDWHSCVHDQRSLVTLLTRYADALEADEEAAGPGEAPHTPVVRWAEATAPLGEVVADLVLGWLPRQPYPVRHGKHQNDAFALRLLLDAYGLDKLGREDVTEACRARALDWFGADTDAPTAWEPGGTDFLSPALTEAALMAQVLPAREHAVLHHIVDGDFMATHWLVSFALLAQGALGPA